MLEPFESSFEEDEGPVTLKDNYPYFGDGTGRSEPITIRNIKIRSESEPVAAASPSDTSATDPDHLREMKSEDAAVRRKTFYHQPRNTLEYTVSGRDTVDSVALQFGSTPSQLMRINHMSSRMIFPGQVIYVPDPMAKEPVCLSPTSPTTKKPVPFSQSLDIPTISQQSRKMDIPTISQADPKPKASKRFGLRKTKSVREDKSKRDSSSWSRKRKFLLRQNTDPPRPGRVVREESKEEEESSDTRQFLKVDVKYITDGEGVVSGTMLVTPNAIMFDPNVSDPLVIDRGTGPYGVITQMDQVLGASMYHDISAMNDKLKPNSNNITCPVYVPEKSQHARNLSTLDGAKKALALATEGGVVLPTTNGGKSETDAKENQELSHETTLETSQNSEVSSTSEVKGQENDSVQKEDKPLGEPDSTTDAAEDHGSGSGSDRMKEESMPLTSGDKSAESSPMIDSGDSENQTKDADLSEAPSLPDSSEGAKPEDAPQENMDIEESTAADDVSQSAVVTEDKDLTSESDQILSTDQEQGSTTTSNVDAMDSELSGTGSSVSAAPGDKSTDDNHLTLEVKGQEITTIAEAEAEKSEDEGVESDLDENDETQPLVSPMAEHEAVLTEELFKQRQMEGYRTLDNEEGSFPGSESIEQELSQTHSADDGSKMDPSATQAADTSGGTPEVDVQAPAETVAMETDTSSTTNAKDTQPPSEIDQGEESHMEKPNMVTSDDVKLDNAPALADVPELTDEEATAISNQNYVDFSSGLFAHNLSGSSLVPDITECVEETGTTQETLKVIQAEGIEIRKKSDGEISSSVEKSESKEKEEDATDADLKEEKPKTDAETNGVRLVSSATDATATKVLEYNKTNLEEFLPRPAQRYEDPPLYLCLRVSKPMQKTFSKDDLKDARPTGKGKLPEYWFAIPRDKADKLYDFFLQWTPDIYGRNLEPADVGFVVVDQEDSSLEVVEDFFDEPITKDWEIITKEEANRRRMTILECEMNLPLPELKSSSELLEDIHIRKLAKKLPPRTEGYSWSLLYSTSVHGFSLTSLYRSMRTVDSPVILAVKDSDNTLFGACVNCGVKVSDHYYGTGETFLYRFQLDELQCFKWTGENNFFVKGDKDCLAIGGGDGTYGLWLDGDLYHGRSRSCKTFANEILSQQEDFVIANMEVWGFVLP